MTIVHVAVWLLANYERCASGQSSRRSSCLEISGESSVASKMAHFLAHFLAPLAGFLSVCASSLGSTLAATTFLSFFGGIVLLVFSDEWEIASLFYAFPQFSPRELAFILVDASTPTESYKYEEENNRRISHHRSRKMPPKKDKKVVAAGEEPKEEAPTDKKPAKGAKK